MKSLSRLVVVCVCLVSASSALAQGEWRYSVSPLVWGAGLNGAVQLGPKTDGIRVGYNDTFGLAEIGGALGFEANNGKVGVLFEAAVVDVSGDADAPDIFHETATASIDHQLYHLAGSYRMRATQPVIDVLLGIRYVDVDADILILSDNGPSRRGVTSQTWADGFFGARVQQSFGEKLWANGRFDVGSGESNLSYQLVLGGGYRFTDSTSLTFGYKVVSTDYDVDAFKYSSNKVSGPYVGMQFDW